MPPHPAAAAPSPSGPHCTQRSPCSVLLPQNLRGGGGMQVHARAGMCVRVQAQACVSMHMQACTRVHAHRSARPCPLQRARTASGLRGCFALEQTQRGADARCPPRIIPGDEGDIKPCATFPLPELRFKDLQHFPRSSRAGGRQRPWQGPHPNKPLNPSPLPLITPWHDQTPRSPAPQARSRQKAVPGCSRAG